MKTTELVAGRRRNILLEALFTPAWAALYEPASRDRWAVDALLDVKFFEGLCDGALHFDDPGVDENSPSAEERLYDATDAQAWSDCGWIEPLRHYLHTNFLPKLDYSVTAGWVEDFKGMRSKIEASPMPAQTKGYPAATTTGPMERPASSMAFTEVLERTGRESDQVSASLKIVGNLLAETFGVSGHKRLAVTGSHVRRTSPSGGSRHPTEAYLLAFNLGGLEPGVYHFNSSTCCLESIRPIQLLETYMHEIFGLNRRINFVPKAAIVLTSVVERSMHRYRDSRSYRVIHLDVGHLLLSLQLLAKSMRIPFFSAYSIEERKVEEMLGIDGLMETAVCQVAIG